MNVTCPRRSACLTEKANEVFNLLGEQDRIAGVSGYTARPPKLAESPEYPRSSPRTSKRSWRSGPISCSPFSDVHADIMRELIPSGVAVFTFNQRGIEEILEMILVLARMRAPLGQQ